MRCVQVHGLVPSGTPAQQTAPPHEILPCGPVSALISGIARPITPDDLSPDDVAHWAMQHNAILTAYCTEATVIPMALGAVFSGKPAIISALAAQMDAHVQNLYRLHDIQEYTVQLNIIGAPKAGPVTADSGRAFLQLQRARRIGRENLHRDRHAFAQDVLSQLQTPAVQIEASASSKPDRLFNCAVLLKKADVLYLQQMARNLHAPAKALGLDLVITGPWPPYSSAALQTVSHREVCHVTDA